MDRLVKEMLLSRRLRGGTICKGAVARLLPRLGFTHAIVVMPVKSAVVIVLILSVANMNTDASTASLFGSMICIDLSVRRRNGDFVSALLHKFILDV